MLAVRPTSSRPAAAVSRPNRRPPGWGARRRRAAGHPRAGSASAPATSRRWRPRARADGRDPLRRQRFRSRRPSAPGTPWRSCRPTRLPSPMRPWPWPSCSGWPGGARRRGPDLRRGRRQPRGVRPLASRQPRRSPAPAAYAGAAWLTAHGPVGPRGSRTRSGCAPCRRCTGPLLDALDAAETAVRRRGIAAASPRTRPFSGRRGGPPRRLPRRLPRQSLDALRSASPSPPSCRRRAARCSSSRR